MTDHIQDLKDTYQRELAEAREAQKNVLIGLAVIVVVILGLSMS